MTPFRWPASWKDPSALALLSGTAIDTVVVERGAFSGALAAAAKQQGITVVDATAPPLHIFVVKGVWPGIQLEQRSADAAAGPTGNPWVDSNGWIVRLESARRPESQIWIDAKPDGARLLPTSYLLAIADCAAYGGRWIITLDDRLADELAQRKPEALATWKRLCGGAGFFAEHKTWSGMAPEAVVGIISDFTGENEFMGHELLNLAARTNQQYRVILKGRLSPSSLAGLRAVIYADMTPPDPVLKARVLSFVEAGGILIAGPKWGLAAGVPSRVQDNPGYVWRSVGKGRVACANAEFDDPWALAQESQVLISHRHDLLRFWNAGSVASYFTMTPDRARAVVHMLFYADRGPTSAVVWAAGRFRAATLWTMDGREPRPLEIELHKDGVEFQLPPVSQYAAVELEV